MDEAQAQPFSSFAHRHRHTVESFVTLFEWLLVAFILALLFQGFAMQAFQIPTGSMAETLRGDHFPICCPRCGFSFDVGSGSLSISRAQCPNCDSTIGPHDIGSMKNGDRIFVLKSIYQFFEPRRWDVVVFKNPTNPKENFIKRLIGLPGETVQLIQGDVYINGQIARKPARVQKELWMPIYLQDHQTVRNNQANEQKSSNQRHSETAEFVNETGSAWDVRKTACYLNDASGNRHTMVYRTDNLNDFNAGYSYNYSDDYIQKPVVSDLMVTFHVSASTVSKFGASLEISGVLYSACIERGGAMVFEKTVNGQTEELRRMLINAKDTGCFERFEFAVVDRQLVLRWGGMRAMYDLTKDPDFAPQSNAQDNPPSVRIFSAGPTELRHIALYRDIYYLGTESFSLRATEDKPLTLKKEQFFVCGDNSNDSHDGRSWNITGVGNGGITYDKGVVPKEYLMGKAVMVYWSQAFCPRPTLPAMVPNLQNLKIVYGSSDEEY